MKKFLLILTVVIMASCSPAKRLARLLERYPIPEKIDTLYIPGKTVYRDTTFFQFLPGEVSAESVYIDVPISIPDTFVEASTSTADAIAWIQDNELGLNLIQYDTVIQWKIDSALVYHTDTVVVTKDIPYPVIEESGVKTFWRTATVILGLIVFLGMILLLVRLRK